MPGHLIHIGYPKSGSTFLQEWFRQNPHLFYAPGALGGFYNVYQISNRASEKADEAFAYYVTSDESLSTPKASSGKLPIDDGKRDYAFPEPAKPAQRKVCSTLKSLYPNAKILFITRGFKSVIMSGYSQYVRSGGVLDFKAFADANVSAMRYQPVGAAYGEEVNYTFIAGIYEEAFGKDNLIILPFELLRDDQKKFLAILETRLALPHFDGQIDKLNESLLPEELYWYPRMSRVVSKVSKRLGKKGASVFHRWYVSKTLENKLRGVINMLSRLNPGHAAVQSEFPEEILNYFRENNSDRFAARFRDDPMYAPYLRDYLLDVKI